MSCRVYQSVFSSEVFATTTSRRTPSTSCAYQSGKVSLSPTVTSTPYGSTELSMSAATSRVAWCWLRDATDQLLTNGTAARSSVGDAASQLRIVGSVTAVRVSRDPISEAIDSQMYTRPSAAH